MPFYIYALNHYNLVLLPDKSYHILLNIIPFSTGIIYRTNLLSDQHPPLIPVKLNIVLVIYLLCPFKVITIPIHN